MRSILLLAAAAILPACAGQMGSDDAEEAAPAPADAQSASDETRAPLLPPGTPPFEAAPVADLDEPWAMTFLPDGRMLVTQKGGTLHVVTQDGDVSEAISGVPAVDYGGQGGLGDIVLAPDYETSGLVYLTFAEAGEGDTRGAAMARGQLDPDALTLREVETIWRQVPKVTGRGHYGHRMAFSPDGRYLFVTSGERQKFDPAQDMSTNLGGILRLNPDGTPAAGNPFADQGSPADERFTLGNRNPLGLAYDADGVLWEHEMGPKGGDEFQRVEAGANYGYPIVSNGDHYDDRIIPDHDTRPGEFRDPDESWNPVISPAGLVIYQGEAFPDWQGHALIGGLSSQALVVVTFDCPDRGREICEDTRYDMGARIREVEEGPDGSVWVLEDGGRGSGGRLLRLTPRR